ncbi:unnamed protein product, partial [marine sediment metagenome]
MVLYLPLIGETILSRISSSLFLYTAVAFMGKSLLKKEFKT